MMMFAFSGGTATLTVTNVNDSGAGSLRQAILDANATPGLDNIVFNIPGSFVPFSPVQRIALFSPLPTITDPVVIDGFTQPGARPNSSPGGNDAVILISFIPGGFFVNQPGLAIQTTNSTVRGLRFLGFAFGEVLRIEGGGNNVIEGNAIGSDGSALEVSPNGISLVITNSSNNRIGGTNAASRNVIAFGSGIVVASGTGNSILGNTIYAVTGPAIDLNRNGPTKNDPGDADGGANLTQNYPLLTAARSSGGGAQIDGSLDSAANETYRLEFFSSPYCLTVSPLSLLSINYANALYFLGATNVTTDASGKTNFSFTSSWPVPAGHLVTATATDSDGNTSEFSPCILLGAYQYVFKPVGSLGNELGQGNDMNNRGEVTGFANTGDGTLTHAFLYSGGQMIDLGVLGGRFSDGLAINDLGDVVGWTQLANSDSNNPNDHHAMLYHNGQMTDLGTLGGKRSEAFGINNLGQIVGVSDTADNHQHVFLFKNGAMTDFGVARTGWGFSWAFDINERGDIVGTTGFSAPSHQFLYQNGNWTLLDGYTDRGGLYQSSFAYRINDSGVAVGVGGTFFSAVEHPTLFQAGTFSVLRTFGGSYARAKAINASRDIVGYVSTQNSDFQPWRACLWRDGELIDLSQVTAGLQFPAWRSAKAINDRGEILVNTQTDGEGVSILGAPGGINRTNIYVLLPLRLDITLSGNSATVSWYTNLTGFVLQSTTNLTAPNSWTTVSPPPVAIGGRYVATSASANAAQFFRLIKP